MAKLWKILIFSALAVAGACNRAPKAEPWYIDRFQLVEIVSGKPANAAAEPPALALSVDEVRKALQSSLEATGRFVALPDGKKAHPAASARVYHCRLDPSAMKEHPDKAKAEKKSAEVGLTLELKRPGEFARLTVTESATETFAAGDAEARRKAWRVAFDKALAQVVQAQIQQLSAIDKDEPALLADLKSTDARARAYAVAALGDRKSKAAVPALIERLEDTDRTVALRAVGALGAIGDPSAVPALIENSRAKDEAFQLSLVEVISTIGGRDAEAYLYTVAAGHPNDAVRQAAQEAQERLAAKAQQPAKAAAVEPEPAKAGDRSKP